MTRAQRGRPGGGRDGLLELVLLPELRDPAVAHALRRASVRHGEGRRGVGVQGGTDGRRSTVPFKVGRGP